MSVVIGSHRGRRYGSSMSETSDKKTGGIASFGVGFGPGSGKTPGEVAGERAPFRIVVLSAVLPTAEHATSAPRPPDPLPIDKPTFDRILAALAPAIAIDVADPFGTGKRLRIDLRWTELRGFRPDGLVEQVPALRALLEARRVLQQVSDGRLAADAARAQLMRLLPHPHWAESLAEGLVGGASSPPGSPTASTTPPAGSGASTGIDALFDRVELKTSGLAAPVPMPAADTAPQADRFGALIARVVGSGRPDSGTPRGLAAGAVSRVEQAFQRLLVDVVRNPEVRRLERAWRGLRLLVERADARAGVEIDLVAAAPDEVEAALTALSERRGEQAHRAPVELLVIDHVVEPTPAALDRLGRWGELAAAMRAPLIVDGAPTLLGVPDLTALASAKKRMASSDEPRALLTRALAGRECARWICIALNGPALRLRWDAPTSRVKEPPFEEPADGAIVFGGAGYVLAALCAASHARLGWPCLHVGPRHGVLENLPVHEVREDAGSYALSLEVLVNTEAQQDVAKAGLTLLSCAANRDSAIVAQAPVLYRGPSRPAGDSPAELTLADQLFAARVANAIEQLAAAIPEGAPTDAVTDVTRVTMAELFAIGTAPHAPEVLVQVDAAKRQLMVTVRPRGFVGVQLEEMTLGAPLA